MCLQKSWGSLERALELRANQFPMSRAHSVTGQGYRDSHALLTREVLLPFVLVSLTSTYKANPSVEAAQPRLN